MKKENLTELFRIFEEKKVVDLKQLMQMFVKRSERSIFRDLKEVKYISSYSHAARYYTLPRVAKFNQDGLWHYKNISFSKHGTLKETTLELLEKSQSGFYHTELFIKLKVRVHNTLLSLIREEKIDRKEIEGKYLYVSRDKKKQNNQISNRQELILQTKQTESLPEWLTIEVLVEVIKISFPKTTPYQIATRLKNRGVTVSTQEVDLIFQKYQIKKNPDLS